MDSRSIVLSDYCNDPDEDLKVIGVIGKEDQPTGVDPTIFMLIKPIISRFLKFRGVYIGRERQ